MKNKELIKLNTEEENFLIRYIKIFNHDKDVRRGNYLIFIDKNGFIELQNFFVAKNNNRDIEKFLLKEYNNCSNRFNFTCRKLTKLYYEKSGVKIGKTTINKILNNNLGLRYRKTPIKTNR